MLAKLAREHTMLAVASSKQRMVHRRSLVFLRRSPCAKPFSSPASPNQGLIQLLTRYKEEEEASEARNLYKIRAFERAIRVIDKMETPVRSGSEVRRLGGVGERIAQRIDAFLAHVPYGAPKKRASHGSSKVTNDSEDMHKTHIMRSLQTISGIGKLKAEALYDAGCRSIAELSKPTFFNLLSPSRRIYAQFVTNLDPIVRLADAEAIKKFVSENISSKYKVFLAGDHRRKQPRSSALSLVIVHQLEIKAIPPHAPYDPKVKPRPPSSSRFYSMHDVSNGVRAAHVAPLSIDVISPLESRGLVAETLAANPQRWKGIIRVPQRTEDGMWEDCTERLRQIREKEGHYGQLQIFFIPRQCQGAALLILTGDVTFIENICDKAHRLALHFNEYGLWKWCDEERWDFLHGDSEEKIFRDLGMEYILPDRRNFAFLSTDRRSNRPRKKIELCKPVNNNSDRGGNTGDHKG